MQAVTLAANAGAEAFKKAARTCLALGLSPEEIVFVNEGAPSLLRPLPALKATTTLTVPRAYANLLDKAICHVNFDRFALLFEVLYRITKGERDLPNRAADPAVSRLNNYAKNVGRDIHKMHAFLRFRPRKLEGRTLFTAWFEPQHYVLEKAVPFFVDRFAQMDWLIATPQGTALWQEDRLSFGPPASRPEQSNDEILDEVWITYYRTTFNPARIRLKAMTSEMPKHYWINMPETAAIPEMVAEADRRVQEMRSQQADQPQLYAERIARWARIEEPIPDQPIAKLRQEAASCERCPLYKHATQTVFGEGPETADIVFVGEQPGDQEDLAGRPFVGPAGQLLDRAMIKAGINRERAYVTNAVKHFKYQPRGKKRIHAKPNAGEIHACQFWLASEILAIKPKLVVAMGATAAYALSGKSVSVTKARGETRFGEQPGFITVHPSFLLRIPDHRQKADEFERLVEDLAAVRNLADTL